MGSHIVGFNFRSIRYLLPVYRLSQFSTIIANGAIFRRSCLSNYLWQPLDIWYATSVWGAILWNSISGRHISMWDSRSRAGVSLVSIGSQISCWVLSFKHLVFIPPLRRSGGYTGLPLSVRQSVSPSVRPSFRNKFFVTKFSGIISCSHFIFYMKHDHDEL